MAVRATFNPVRNSQRIMSTAAIADMRILNAAFTSDPDDAFAWWALATGRLEIPGCRVATRARHIQEINEACIRGEYDIAAVSSAAWPKLCDDYYILEA